MRALFAQFWRSAPAALPDDAFGGPFALGHGHGQGTGARIGDVIGVGRSEPLKRMLKSIATVGKALRLAWIAAELRWQAALKHDLTRAPNDLAPGL